MTATKTYTVTERAGKRVAGRIVKAQDVLTLTPDEAAYHLAAGEIVAKGDTLDKAYTTSRIGETLNAAARAFRDRAAAPAAPAIEAKDATPGDPASPAAKTDKKS